MPSSAKMPFTAFRISAWGVGEAATFRVTVSAGLEAAAEPDAEAEPAEPETAGAEVPQAAREAVRPKASARASNFFFMVFLQ
ncbi:hypothetical protein SDC9_83422 [bioreactor metagenome]|uniref:Uncharacterized protein n=1 Tax=bioreactor metagenome TaxID=1076179 RepID=A0A644Z875_9ZZZZ